MKSGKSLFTMRAGVLWVALLLGVVLAMQFWQSFLPGIVHFSNDGPLGVQESEWCRLPGALTSAWIDLNSIGVSVGACAPTIATFIRWLIGPVGYAKFLAPITLWILGLSAWTFFRRLGLTPLACALGALAIAINGDFFSTACWGVAAQDITFGMNFLALALVVSNTATTPFLLRWTRVALAGLAVGMGVMEGADIGAIFSLFVAAFVLFKSLQEGGTVLAKIARGVGRVAIVAVFAAFIASQTLLALVGTQVKGIVGTGQDAETKSQHWDWATQWSLPKRETLGLFVPGLFGYRMDTPGGGNYWGAMGRDPAWDRYFESDRQGPPPVGYMRFSGGGNYCGVLVCVVAIWAMAQALRRKESAFSEVNRQHLWFWTAVLIISLLLAWGRFAPFYKLFYMLPGVSTMRNPAKFLHIFSWALTIIFAYGVHGLSRRHLEVGGAGMVAPVTQLKSWWAKAQGFDRKWAVASVVAVATSLLGWLIYASHSTNFVAYLQTVQFDEAVANQVAAFSIGQVGLFVLLLAISVGLITLILSGALAGRRARWAGIFLGLFLVADLEWSDRHWTVFWDYPQKYATNPIIDLLRDKPYEHRVAILPFRSPPKLSLLEQLYRMEWAQQHFPYYNIQSLDIIQMPRMPEDLAAFEGALNFRGTSESLHLVARRWQLTNTRYLLGAAGFLDTLNEQIDPAQHGFRIVERFDIVPKPGIYNPTRLEELTAVLDTNGNYALFNFTGALPRAKLYSHWLVSTNDQATLSTLSSAGFDPDKEVLVSTPLPTSPAGATNQNPGTVNFASYAPSHITFNAQVVLPSVLLFNDKFDPDWRVLMDGQPVPLLRCNFIMRGVFLMPGSHTVEFIFKPVVTALYTSLAAIAIGLLLIGYLIVSRQTVALTPTRPANSDP